MFKKFEERWTDVFNDFYETHPHYQNRIVEWYPSGHYEFTFKTDNGVTHTYNWRSGKVYCIKDIKYFDENEYSEEKTRELFKYTLNAKLNDICMSQEYLAKETGISKVTINKYCTGKALPNYINIGRIAKALGCSVNELYAYR